MNNSSLDTRNQLELEQVLLEADNIVMKKYMSRIGNYKIKEIDESLEDVDINSVFRLNKIEKIVYNSDEDNLEKLMNVYNAVGLCGGSVVNIVVSDGDSVKYYIGTKSEDINHIAICQDTLKSSFLGNFAGSSIRTQSKKELTECMERIFGKKTISVVSGIPGLRDEENKGNKENKNFVQGMEKIIDSMKDRKYCLITISTPLTGEDINRIRGGYEDIYSQISPFSESQLSYNESDSISVAETLTDGITSTIGDSLTETISNSTTNTEGTNKSSGWSAIVYNNSGGENHSKSIQSSESHATSQNSSVADSHSTSKSDTRTNTNGRTLQISSENKKVKDLMSKIDSMVERIDDSADLGLWNVATYCIADDSQTSLVLANAVESVCRGDKSSIEAFAIHSWSDSLSSSRVQKYLKNLMHPILLVDEYKNKFEISPTSLINGKELVIEAGLPQKSVSGLPISEMVSFSRNVVNDIEGENDIVLGNIFHMGQAEKTKVNLDLESLSAHTLVTGSTGAGKSNTVYHLLDLLKEKGIHFLVVEPAKGEYKNVFGNYPDIKVFGTNEKYTDLLKINPFKFPESIHVLEHIDRLVEIFNVCWPMYAAMPAVLKDAVLNAYESCGWDLDESENENGKDVFPTFKDLQRELVYVIEASSYSDEVKSNYIGSLATRVKSLTNGIYRKIFTSNELDYKDLFDENVIIDLSRVGSSESKSLIMGLIVMSLNEYRMDQFLGEMDQNLRHVTVLEEAHNLLRNTQVNANSSDEGGNVAGKSVEMIANSIAEMRTYGEGFIIVDQSPSAIDISAIRNTNTKIIMRLPEEYDRQQAGKSAALRDEQIDELAKLQRGVAVVYQNNWLEPVLCAIPKACVKKEKYAYEYVKNVSKKDYSDLLKMLMKNRVDEKIEYDIDMISETIENSEFSTKTKLALTNSIKDLQNGIMPPIMKEDYFKNLSDIVVEIMGCEDKIKSYSEFGTNCEMLQSELDREINKHVENSSLEMRLALSQCIIRKVVENDKKQVDLYSKWREFALMKRG